MMPDLLANLPSSLFFFNASHLPPEIKGLSPGEDHFQRMRVLKALGYDEDSWRFSQFFWKGQLQQVFHLLPVQKINLFLRIYVGWSLMGGYVMRYVYIYR
jgi:hypothetical protein